MIHRDVKPPNLLLGNDGTVKILEMGLARIATPGGDASTQAELNCVSLLRRATHSGGHRVRRSWFQFTLRFLFYLTTLSAVASFAGPSAWCWMRQAFFPPVWTDVDGPGSTQTFVISCSFGSDGENDLDADDEDVAAD